MTEKKHGGRRDNTKRRPDDKRGGKRVAGEGKKLGRPKKVLPPIPPMLNSATNLQNVIMNTHQLLRQVHDAADILAPNATPELWNAIESLRGALRDIAPYAQREHQEWLNAELERQRAD